jgi:RimJ/RimL family protein N-acetyltransferase
MLSLRPATLKDAELLLKWRNDPETRRQSRNTGEAFMEGHIAWLIKSLAMPSRKLYIAEDDGMPVGTVRADEDTDGYTEISYTVAPSARGKGYGKRMVVQFVQEQLMGKKIKAEIKKGDNEASEGIAKALGLTPTEERPSEDPNDPRPLVMWR